MLCGRGSVVIFVDDHTTYAAYTNGSTKYDTTWNNTDARELKKHFDYFRSKKGYVVVPSKE